MTENQGFFTKLFSAESWKKDGPYRNNFNTILGAIALALLLRIVLIEPFEIDGPSMEPSLYDGDRIVVSKVSFGLFLPGMSESVLSWGTPSLGDIVILNSPQANSRGEHVDIVKRVIGLEGDIIEVRDSLVYRNGEILPTRLIGPCEREAQLNLDPHCKVFEQEIDGTPFLLSRAAPKEGEAHFIHHDIDSPPRIVPEGHVFVLGDHRDHSNDSRNIGPIPIRRIKGKALFVYMSISEKGGFRWERTGHIIH